MDPFWLARKGKEATEEESKEGVVGVAGLTEDTNTHFHTVANTSSYVPIPHTCLQSKVKTISKAGATGALCSDNDNA